MTVLKGFDFTKQDSIKQAESNEDTEHFYRYVKAGETISVGLLQPSEYAQVAVYDVYPITSTVGIPQEDLFKKAKAEMMRLADEAKAEAFQLSVKDATDAYNKMSPNDKEAFKEGKGSEWYKLIKEAYRFAEQVRFLFGFYDFNTGSPFVIQTTKKQAEGIYKKIAEAWMAEEGETPEAHEYAFTISKGTGGFALDINTKKKIFKLSKEEQANHEKYRNQVITEEEFDNAHFKLSVDAQKDAIKEFASHHPSFNFSNVWTETGDIKEEHNDGPFSRNEGQPLDIDEDSLPF